MNHLYADVSYVTTAMEKAIENTTLDGENTHIDVYDSDAAMRGITPEERKDRNLHGDTLGTMVGGLQYDGTRWTLSFHEKIVEGKFTLTPAGPSAIAAKQAPNPDELAPKLSRLVSEVESEYDVISWDFTEVSAASIANGGHFTDFEFEYVITI